MKLMVASDIHGSALYCAKMLEAFAQERAGRLLLLGDLLYHGPRNDLPRGYDPKEVIRLLNGQKSALLCVRGNCDTEVDQMVLEFPILAEYCLAEHGGRALYATHGHHVSRPHPHPCLGELGAGRPAAQPRLRLHPQGGQPAQLPGAGGGLGNLENPGGRGVPPPGALAPSPSRRTQNGKGSCQRGKRVL